MNDRYKDTIFILDKALEANRTEFTIITAYNPMDKILPEELNEFNSSKLLRQLMSFNRDIITLYGCSQNLAHQEKSYLIEIALEDAIQIGNEFNQRAIFWCKLDDLFIIECRTRKTISIGSFEDRIRLN